jgi:hypothetical protein
VIETTASVFSGRKLSSALLILKIFQDFLFEGVGGGWGIFKIPETSSSSCIGRRRFRVAADPTKLLGL